MKWICRCLSGFKQWSKPVARSSTPALNQTLGEGGNLALVLGLTRGRPVWFDAWSLGMGHTGTVMGLIRQFGMLPAILQVVLVIVVYHWSGRGHQRTPPARPRRRRASSEQLQTLGYLYARSMPAEELARRTYTTILHRLSEALKWPVGEVEARLGIGETNTPQVTGDGETPPSGSGMSEQELAEARTILQQARQLTGRFHVRCRRCGYNLVGSGGSECPECGQSLEPHQRRQLALIPPELASETQPPGRRDIQKQAIDLIDRTHRLTEALQSSKTTG
jgi:ribosomal protein L37E